MSRFSKRSYSRYSRDYHDDREGGHRDYHHGDEAARGPRFPGSQSRSRSRSRSRDRGSVGGDWDWKRRPLRVLSPQSPLRTQSPFRGRGSGRPSPRRGRGSQLSPLSSGSQVSHPHGPRFETHEVDFHDDQVRGLLFSNDHKFMIEIKKKFPGVSRIDLAMKKGIAFSGSSGAVKGAMMFLFHQLQKRHSLQYPQIRDVAMNISGNVAQGVRSPSQSPQPNNNRGDQSDSGGIEETLTGANTEPIVKKRKEISFPQPVAVKNLEAEIQSKSNLAKKSCKAIKINMKSSSQTPEIKKTSIGSSKTDGKSIPNKTDELPPDNSKSKDESRTLDSILARERALNALSTAKKDTDENGNGDGLGGESDRVKLVEHVPPYEPNELETWKNNYKDLQEKCKDMSTRLQNEVQAAKKDVADRDLAVTEKDKTIHEKETENENLRKALEEAKGKVNDALSQCKQFYDKSQNDATILKEKETRIKELEERLSGRSGSTEEVIIKKEVGAEEQENVKLRKENHELTKRLRILEDKYNGKKRLIYIRDLEIKELYKETARLNQELGKEILDSNGVMTVDLTSDAREQGSDHHGNTPK